MSGPQYFCDVASQEHIHAFATITGRGVLTGVSFSNIANIEMTLYSHTGEVISGRRAYPRNQPNQNDGFLDIGNGQIEVTVEFAQLQVFGWAHYNVHVNLTNGSRVYLDTESFYINPVRVESNGHSNYCRSHPCGAGEGDCDGDVECEPGLQCLDNAGPLVGLSASIDVCGASTAALIASTADAGVADTGAQTDLGVSDSGASLTFGPNLVLNPSVEAGTGSTPSNWSTSGWGSNDRSFTWTTSGASNGSRAARVAMTTHTSGDARWEHSEVTVSGGQAVSLGFDYRADVNTTIVLRYTHADSSVTREYLGLSSDTAWSPYSRIVFPPATAVGLTVYVALSGVGFLEVDNMHIASSAPSSPADAGWTDAGVGMDAEAYDLGGAEDAGVFDYGFADTGTADSGASLDAGDASTTDIGTGASQSQNLILNASAETGSGSAPSNWSTSGWGNNDRSFTWTTSGASNGSRAVRVEMTTHSSGDARWQHSEVTVAGGQATSLGLDYRANVGTTMVLRYTHADSSVTREYVPLPSSTNWSRHTQTVTPPATAVGLTVYVALGAVGYVEVDNLFLSTLGSPSAPPSNLILNASVETGSGSAPSNWSTSGWGSNDRSFTWTTSGASDGSRAVRVEMTTHSSGDARWEHDEVTITGSQALSLALDYRADVGVTLVLRYTHSDNTVTRDYVPLASTTTWTSSTHALTPPATAVGIKAYVALGAVGYVEVDAFSLTSP
ncbi:MAG: hypothetical protein AAFZ18_13320 [Myxococcota bacterium]